MKLTRILISLFVFTGLFAITPNTVNAGSFSSYVSGITMQNLTNSTANVYVYFYNQDGSLALSVPDTISPYGVKDYATVPVGSGFNGSVIISSDSQIGAVSTLRGDNQGRGAYSGAETGDTSIVIPILMKNWGSSQWYTWFSVQNTGTGDANISVDYAACAPAVDDSASGVKAGAAAVFDQADETCFPTAKTLTSAVVTSNQPINVVVSQESAVVKSALVSSGFPEGDTNPVIPLMNSNNPNTTGWRTAISVFNDGNSATDVTMTYVKASDGTECHETQNIPSKASKIFAGNNLITGAPAGVTLDCTVGERLVGSAFVSANSNSQPLVATVNQDRGSLASAYGALSPSAATPKVVFPQIQDRNGAASQWASSLMVTNVGNSTTFVKCTFANAAYSPDTGTLGLGSYKSWEDLERNNIAPSYVGSGECTAYTDNTYTTVDAAATIVAVVNIRGTGVGLFDLMMSYEGINVTP